MEGRMCCNVVRKRTGAQPHRLARAARTVRDWRLNKRLIA